MVGLTRYAVLATLLVVLSLAAAFWTLGFIVFLVTSPFDGGTTGGFVIIELPLLAVCWALFRHVRGLRWWFRGRRTTRLRRRRTVAGTSAREPLPWSATNASFGYRLSASAKKLSTGLRPDKLEQAEQSLGNTLYQLDLTRDQYQLTREQIAELRVLGLRASAWLNSRTEFVFVDKEGFGAAKDQLNTGVQRYTALAKAAADFLAGRLGVAEVVAAGDTLANWIE